jgi:Mor family transcriptional regulator
MSELREEVKAVVGEQAADRLLEYFAGQVVYFPVGGRQLEARDERIREEARQGVPTNDLARKYNLSSRRVCAIVRES